MRMTVTAQFRLVSATREKVVEKDANGKKSVAHRHGVNKAQMGHFKKAGVSERDSFASSNSKTQMSTI